MSLNVFSSYTIPIENLEIDKTIVRRATLHLNINGVPIPFTTKQETANGWDIFTKLNSFHPPSLCPFAPCVFYSDGINILSIIGIILMREGNCRGVLLMFIFLLFYSSYNILFYRIFLNFYLNKKNKSITIHLQFI